MKKQMSAHAQCAKEIRQDLKKAFPGVKFSVRSDTFSMGNSVDVSWTDGPTDEAVSAIVRKYQYGHFDGMVDMYEYSNKREDIAQVKFVQTHRTMSDEIRDKIIKSHNDKFCEEGQINDINAWNNDAQCWNSTLIYRYFNKLDLVGAAQ